MDAADSASGLVDACQLQFALRVRCKRELRLPANPGSVSSLKI